MSSSIIEMSPSQIAQGSANEEYSNPYTDFSQDDRPIINAPITEGLKNPLDQLSRWTWRIVGVTSVVTMFGSWYLSTGSVIVTGPQASAFGICLLATTTLCGALAAIGLIAGLILMVVAPKQRRQIERMAAGHYLVRWDLSPEQWEAFIADEQKKANEVVATSCVVLGIVGVVVGVAFYEVAGLAGLFAIVLGSLGVGYFFGQVVSWIKKWRLSAMAGQPRFTVIGLDGLYFRDRYFPYSTFGSGLDSLTATETESMHYLVFDFYTQTKNGRVNHEQRVPVPHGLEAEAKWVRQQLG